MIGVGAVLVFRVTGAVFDKQTGTATKWMGFLIPFTRKTVPLASLKEVLILPTGEIRIEHPEVIFIINNRKKAEQIAKFLGLPVQDRTGASEAYWTEADVVPWIRSNFTRRAGLGSAIGVAVGLTIWSNLVLENGFEDVGNIFVAIGWGGILHCLRVARDFGLFK